MVFAHDIEASLAAAAALVNTPLRHSDGADRAAPGISRTWTVRGPPGDGPAVHCRDQAELQAVRDLRPRLRRIWEADEDEVVRIVNGLLREFLVPCPRLVRHDQWAYHLHATASDAPLAARIAVEAAMAMVDVVRGGELAPAAHLPQGAGLPRTWSWICPRTGRNDSAMPGVATGMAAAAPCPHPEGRVTDRLGGHRDGLIQAARPRANARKTTKPYNSGVRVVL